MNPADARYGNGQYLSDIQPGTFVIPNEDPLDIVGRVLGWGKNQ